DLFQPRNAHQRKLIQSNLTAWKLFFWIFLFFATGSVFFWSSYPILDKTVKDYRLPFFAWYPYNFKISPQYELTYFYQVVAIIYVATVNNNIDTLIAALNMYIGAQFDILCDDVKNLQDDENDSEGFNTRLKSCIHHHREILK
ncbi:7tm 6 domain containing protein, partial [Asbolus verrucosus]